MKDKDEALLNAYFEIAEELNTVIRNGVNNVIAPNFKGETVNKSVTAIVTIFAISQIEALAHMCSDEKERNEARTYFAIMMVKNILMNTNNLLDDREEDMMKDILSRFDHTKEKPM